MRGGQFVRRAGLAGLIAAMLIGHVLPAGGRWGIVRAGSTALSGLLHALFYTALLILFAASLRPGRVPVITRLARRLQPGFTPAMERYTRHVTVAWCLFFAAQLLASVLLAGFAPLRAWVMFVTVFNLPLIATFFAAEYAIRLWRFRGHQRVSVAETVRAFRQAWR